MNGTARKVALFRNNRNQAVRIPKDLELPGEEAIIRKEGQKLILEPASTASLTGLLKTLDPLDEGLPAIDDPRPEGVDI
ncbi:antitoxin [Hoeflea poritis]|uniref:AbrB/MazE/SpoVT family DNA-binding domain-containing protein n=1 Tax=Hoeflea poritis TaxID=2993659 RepID=A0ABT4VLB2_9HYPH|nr:AbrB/MazE/SpoVT family DNA-binding domain-containing protein [Hoeflea poritis]MDA4845506.1 AbrB/MazE/SpoVT family DNA-binding domain-containing protein [Hoeflea poritis]